MELHHRRSQRIRNSALQRAVTFLPGAPVGTNLNSTGRSLGYGNRPWQSRSFGKWFRVFKCRMTATIRICAKLNMTIAGRKCRYTKGRGDFVQITFTRTVKMLPQSGGWQGIGASCREKTGCPVPNVRLAAEPASRRPKRSPLAHCLHAGGRKATPSPRRRPAPGAPPRAPPSPAGIA